MKKKVIPLRINNSSTGTIISDTLPVTKERVNIDMSLLTPMEYIFLIDAGFDKKVVETITNSMGGKSIEDKLNDIQQDIDHWFNKKGIPFYATVKIKNAHRINRFTILIQSQ